MATKDRITQADTLEPGVIKSFGALNTQMDKSVALMAALAKNASDFQKSIPKSSIDALTESQKKYNTERQKGTKASKEALSAEEKIRKKIQQVSIAEEKAKIALQEKKKAIRDNIKAQKQQEQAIGNLVQELKTEIKTEAQATEQNKRLLKLRKQLNTTTAKGAKQTSLINKQLDKNNAILNKQASAYGKQKRNIGNYKSALQGIGSQLGIITGGVALAAAAIRKGIQITKQAIEVNREFARTFANVLTLLDDAQKKEFGVELQRGSVDLIAKYGLEIADVNKALFDTISAGVDAKNAISFLDKAAILATGGVTDLSTAVDGVTSVINAYGLSAEETESVTNAFFTSQKYGKTTVEELSKSIGKVAPIAKQAGVGYREVLASLAELTKQGLSTDDATTALKSTITAIISPSKEAAGTFEKLGISTGASAVKQEGLFNILMQVSRAAQEDSDVLTKLIPNVRALTGVGALGTEALADYDEILKVIQTDLGENSSLQQAFNEQIKTGANQSEAMSGSYKRMLITLGGGESVFKKIGDSIRKELTQEFDNTTYQIEKLKLFWDRLKGDLTKEEWRASLVELEKRFSGIVEPIEDTTDATNENTDATNENTDANAENNEETEKKLSLIAQINEKIAETTELRDNAVSEEALAKHNQMLIQLEKEKKRLTELGTVRATGGETMETIEGVEVSPLEQQEEEQELELASMDAHFEQVRKLQAENEEKIKKLKMDSWREWTQFATNQASQLASSIFQYQNQELQNEQQMAIEKAKARGASEEEIAKIEKKYAKERQQNQVKQAIINGALAVVNALTVQPFWLGLVLAGVAAATTAIQVATIKAQKFAKGTKDSGGQGQVAWVGDGGEPELITHPDGSQYWSPDTDTLTYLPPHSKVEPLHALQRDAEDMSAISKRTRLPQHDAQAERRHAEMMQALNKKDETYINVTKKGFGITAKKGSTLTNYITNKYRR